VTICQVHRLCYKRQLYVVFAMTAFDLFACLLVPARLAAQGHVLVLHVAYTATCVVCINVLVIRP
jgi:hypothetical protein